MEETKKEIKIKVRDEDLKGVYSNLMQIFNNKEEFVLDFFMVSPPQGILSSRVIVGPSHVKRMVRVLSNSIERYEQSFGKIEAAKEPEKKIGFNN